MVTTTSENGTKLAGEASMPNSEPFKGVESLSKSRNVKQKLTYSILIAYGYRKVTGFGAKIALTRLGPYAESFHYVR